MLNFLSVRRHYSGIYSTTVIVNGVESGNLNSGLGI